MSVNATSHLISHHTDKGHTSPKHTMTDKFHTSWLVTFRRVLFAGIPPDGLQALLDVVAVEGGLIGQQSIEVEGRMLDQVTIQCLETLHDNHPTHVELNPDLSSRDPFPPIKP